jgi:3-hydroxyisobutyrate dehydrogenase-like beta-hydroxyacid dehydrogenase
MRLGVIGFGEAGQQICTGLKGAGFADIGVYDKYLATKPAALSDLSKHGFAWFSSLEDLVSKSDVVFSVVTGSACKEVASQAAQFVHSGQLFVDLATKSPEIAVQNSQEMAAKGALYVDGAMLGPLIVQGYKVPTAASGDGAEQFHDLFSPWGMDIQVIPGAPGKASAVKLVRSIFMKGLASISVEAFLAARLYGVQSDVLASVDETLRTSSTSDMIHRFLRGTAIHAARRAHEMEDVIHFLERTELPPITSSATLAAHRWVESLRLGDAVTAAGTLTIEELSDMYISQVRTNWNPEQK